MTKIKENWTIDKEISDWIRKKEGVASNFVNKILKKAMDEDQDEFNQLEILEHEGLKIDEKRQILLKKVVEIAKKGNIFDRKRASMYLKKEAEKNEKRQKEAQTTVKMLEGIGFISALISCGKYEDFLELRRRIVREAEIPMDVSTLIKAKQFLDSKSTEVPNATV